MGYYFLDMCLFQDDIAHLNFLFQSFQIFEISLKENDKISDWLHFIVLLLFH